MPRSAFTTANHLGDRGSLADQLVRQNKSEIDDLLAAGWTIKSENGRQVILERDGQTVTRYRPKK
jgi:hypothetical protein